MSHRTVRESAPEPGAGAGREAAPGPGRRAGAGSGTGSGAGGERGQAAVEFAGVITLLLVVALVAVQFGVVAYTAQQAGTAARAAARAAAQKDGEGKGEAAGRAALSGWLADGASVDASCGGGDEVSATVTVAVPELLPLFDLGPATRTVTMRCD
ncbi:TadE/TadG family type IV pilus assembly protein [Streptomyces sp. NPDC014894]|uniref:TadE/TadG family type IV pilus assembly protein n=1 Tax=Streptomyces sp. NPDC014894 TaxID=3364931 RepID=UPI0036FB534D